MNTAAPFQPTTFTNRFGTVVVTPAMDFMPVRGIRKTHPVAMANTFDLTTAEQIALVTENRGLQICPHFPMDGLAYLLMHNTPSTAAICRVEVVDFACAMAPGDMLGELNWGQGGF